MTEKFDADKHRFGMAYHFHDDVVYPFSWSSTTPRVDVVDGHYIAGLDGRVLTRAPENDLVPVADVKLVDNWNYDLTQAPRDGTPFWGWDKLNNELTQAWWVGKDNEDLEIAAMAKKYNEGFYHVGDWLGGAVLLCWQPHIIPKAPKKHGE